MASVMPMFSSNIVQGRYKRLTILVFAFAACLRGTETGNTAVAAPLSTHLSPEPMEVAPQDAWRLAEQFAAARPDCDVVVGRGDSMLPLYRDRTVLVLERMQMSALRPGMTVVFLGDTGRPVAHTLVEKTWRGWRAAGVASRQRDQTLIQARNYIGTVVRAFAPNRAIPSLAEQRLPTNEPVSASSALGDQ